MGRPVVHWEFWSEDPQKTSDFYVEVFGWDVRFMPDMDYRLVETGGEGGINGGIMKPKSGPWPAKLALYIDVDDLDAYGARVGAAGGKIVVDKLDIPGVGCLSLFEDPDGRVIGMWKRLAKMTAEEDYTMEGVLTTTNQGLLAVFETVLNGAEIPYFIRGAEAVGLLPLNATVVVPSKHVEAARELLREAEEAHETPED